MLGATIGEGLIIFRIVKSDVGLARIEIGRSSFRHAASPPFLPCLASSLRYLVAPEFPLCVNVPRLMGLQQIERCAWWGCRQKIGGCRANEGWERDCAV